MQSENATGNRIVYDASLVELYKIWFLNIIFNILTLGIHIFWGKTRLQRFLTVSFSIEDERLKYTGTSGEIVMGFLKALPIIIIVFTTFFIWKVDKYPLVNFMWIPVIFLLKTSAYSIQKYRYSRTAWRGVSMQLKGSAWTYAAMSIGLMILNIVTLGIMKPFNDIKQQKYKIENTFLGTIKGEFTGDGMELFNMNIITLLLLIPTLGMSRIWYVAALRQHIISSTKFGNISFRSTQTAGKTTLLLFGNFLIFLFTLIFCYIIMNITIWGNNNVKNDNIFHYIIYFFNVIIMLITNILFTITYVAIVTYGLFVSNDNPGSGIYVILFGWLLILITPWAFCLPVVIHRNMQFLANNVVVVGDIHTLGILQPDE